MTTTISPVTEASLAREFEHAIRSEYRSLQHYRRMRDRPYYDSGTRGMYADCATAASHFLWGLLAIRRRARR